MNVTAIPCNSNLVERWYDKAMLQAKYLASQLRKRNVVVDLDELESDVGLWLFNTAKKYEDREKEKAFFTKALSLWNKCKYSELLLNHKKNTTVPIPDKFDREAPENSEGVNEWEYEGCPYPDVVKKLLEGENISDAYSDYGEAQWKRHIKPAIKAYLEGGTVHGNC